MSRIDHGQRRIDCKVVYYGPRQSGKTTALTHIHEQLSRGTDVAEVHSPAPDGESYDRLRLSLGAIRGFGTHLELFTVPGDPHQDTVRFRILDKVDGVIFVADARVSHVADNHAAVVELERHLTLHGLALHELPFVVQVNKMDLVHQEPPAPLAMWLPPPLMHAESVPSIATEGVGVFDSLKSLSKQMLTALWHAQGWPPRPST